MGNGTGEGDTKAWRDFLLRVFSATGAKTFVRRSRLKRHGSLFLLCTFN
jgi:hypothetical protein